ncbi:MAG: nitroreductase family protein [Candidatus Aenigmarchaeota archaeon]|nr:nitroreductase family protein [Candidatus Aenigmarchaeota archaeon]MCX8179163.1 nitroreductase family protein [Candidatus Aenigmarchaeota archaeon]
MDFFEVVEKRRSIRKFLSKKIEEEKLLKLLNTANLAPSAGNLQAFEIFLVRDEKKKQMICKASYNQDFIKEADVVLIFCANPSRSMKWYGERGEFYALQDATISAAYVQLAAAALGLGSVWIGAFDEKKISEIIELSDNLRPVAIIPIGYPAEAPTKKPRRKLNDLVKQV